jgi:hypothetical protein
VKSPVDAHRRYYAAAILVAPNHRGSPYRDMATLPSLRAALQSTISLGVVERSMVAQ